MAGSGASPKKAPSVTKSSITVIPWGSLGLQGSIHTMRDRAQPLWHHVQEFPARITFMGAGMTLALHSIPGTAYNPLITIMSDY